MRQPNFFDILAINCVLVLLLKKTLSKCLLFSSDGQLCLLCDRDFYPTNYQMNSSNGFPENFCVPKNLEVYSNKVFISDLAQCERLLCDGSAKKPFKYLSDGLIKEYEKSLPYKFSNISFFIFSQNLAAYFFPIDANQTYELFRQVESSIFISPGWCKDFPNIDNCVSENKQIKLILKTDKLQFFILRKIEISSILIDATDLVLKPGEPCLMMEKVCCTHNGSGDPKEISCEAKAPDFDFFKIKENAFFSIYLVSNSLFPELRFTNCEIKSLTAPRFSYFIYNSLGAPFHLSVVNSSFTYNLLASSLIDFSNRMSSASTQSALQILEITGTKFAYNNIYIEKELSLIEIFNIYGKITLTDCDFYKNSLKSQIFSNIFIKFNGTMSQSCEIFFSNIKFNENEADSLVLLYSSAPEKLVITLNISMLNNILNKGLRFSNINYAVVSMLINGALPIKSLIETLFSKINITNSSISQSNKLIEGKPRYIIFSESSYPLTLKTQFARKFGLGYTAIDEIYIENLRIFDCSFFSFFNNKHSVRHLFLINCSLQNSNFSAFQQEFIFACVEGKFLIADSVVRNISFYSNFIAINPAYNVTLLNTIFENLSFFDTNLILMRSITEFNEFHIFNYTNIIVKNIEVLYVDLSKVNTNIKRILMQGGYELSGEGPVMVMNRVYIRDIRFEYFQDYSLVFYSPSGYLLVDKLYVDNITNTTIFYFLVTATGGKLVLKNIATNLKNNDMARFIKVSIETYDLAHIENFFLVGNIFKTNSILLLSNPKIFIMNSSLISAACQSCAHLVLKVYSVFDFLLKNCTFFAELSLHSNQKTSAIWFQTSVKSDGISSNKEHGIVNCTFSYFSDSVIKLLSNSEIVINQIEALFCFGINGGFLLTDVNCKASIRNFQFRNISVLQDGGIINMQSSSLELRNGTTNKIGSFSKGGLLSAVSCLIDIANLTVSEISSNKGALIMAESCSIYLLTFMIKSVFSEKSGGLMLIKTVNITLNDVYVYETRAGDRAGALYCENSNIVMTNCLFNGVEAYLSACFFLNAGYLTIEKCNFTENNSTSGTIILAYDASFKIINCEFIRNTAIDGSLFSSQSSVYPRSSCIIQNSLFSENNIKGGGIFYLKEFDIIIVQVDLREIDPDLFIIKGTKTNASLTKIIFVSNFKLDTPTLSQKEDNYLFSFKEANILIINTFLSCDFAYGGVVCQSCNQLFTAYLIINRAKSIKGASLKAENCGFIFLDSTNITNSVSLDSSGGSVYAFICLKVVLRNCLFKGNTGENVGGNFVADLYVYGVLKNSYSAYNLTIISTKFEILKAISIYGGNINMVLMSLTVFSDIEKLTQFLNCVNCFELHINKCEFKNIRLGGVISFKSHIRDYTSILNISETVFFSCSNLFSGGAVSASGSLTLLINRTSFIDIFSEESGGCIFFSPPPDQSNSKFSVLASTFERCVAKKKGGAIFSTIATILIDETTCFFENKAEVGFNLASSISKFYMNNEQNTLKEKELFIIKIGQSINLNITILDRFDNIIIDQQEILVNLTLEESLDNNISLLNNMLLIKDGMGYLREFKITAVKAFENVLVKAQLLTKNFEIVAVNEYNFSLQACAFGEVFNENICKACPENYYSILLNPMEKNGSYCLKCPLNSICSGGYNMIPKPGFWRSENSSLIVKCNYPTLCPQNQTIFRWDRQCRQSFEGNLCQSCKIAPAPIYFIELCERCSQSIEYWILVSCGFLLFFLFILFTKQSMTSSSEAENYKDLQVLTKILVNHFSHLTVLTVFEISVAEDIPKIFSNKSTDYTKSSPSTQIFFSHDCFFNLGLGTTSKNNFILTCISPLILFLMYQIIEPLLISSFRICLKIVKACFSRDFTHLSQIPREGLKVEVILNFGVLLMNIYPAILIKLFKGLRCLELVPSEAYMKMKPDVRCWSEEHVSFLIWAAVFISIWGLGFPLFLFFLSRSCLDLQLKQLKKTRYSKRNMENSLVKLKLNSLRQVAPLKSQTGNESQSMQTFTRQLYSSKSIRNFVFLGYRVNFYFWESVVYLRKFFLFAVTLLEEFIDPNALTCLFIIVIFAFLIMNEMLIIYESPTLSKYEGLSLLITIASFCLAQVASMGETATIFKYILLISIFVINGYFVISWLIFYLRSSKILKRGPKNRKTIAQKQKLHFVGKKIR